MNKTNNNEILSEEKPSKSQLKRDMIALQQIGETLVNLSNADLKKIPLEPNLAKEIDAARQIKSHEAKRRQLQYIGRLMREIDPQPIQMALEKIQLKGRQSKAQLNRIERWRDQLIGGDDADLQNFISQYPNVDSQQLRQLIRNAKKNIAGSEKAVFRFIRENIS